jgi:hypothetical protein
MSFQNHADYLKFLKSNFKNWTSNNEDIDEFIQDKQLEINDYDDIVFEWIPYNQFYEIKETGKNDSITIYSVIWKDGPLYWNKQNNKYEKFPNKKVALKYLHNKQYVFEILYEV